MFIRESRLKIPEFLIEDQYVTKQPIADIENQLVYRGVFGLDIMNKLINFTDKV